MLLFLKNLLFTIVVPGTVAVYVPLFFFSHAPPQLTAISSMGGILLTISGAIYCWCLWDFAVSGQGTPAPIDPPKNLVVRGLYQYTRNPMYVSVVGAIFGWALLFTTPQIALYGLSVATFFHLFVLFYEEPFLKRQFGSGYEEYCQKVSRWLPIRRSS